jgi:predicted ester cyclase
VARDIEQIDLAGMTAWDQHDVDGFMALLADGFVWTDVTLPEPMRTLDQARQYMQEWFTAFPDMRTKQTNRVVGEDAVAAEVEFSGTNSGPMLMGGAKIPPTGRSVVGRGKLLRAAQRREDHPVQLLPGRRRVDDATKGRGASEPVVVEAPEDTQTKFAAFSPSPPSASGTRSAACPAARPAPPTPPVRPARSPG